MKFAMPFIFMGLLLLAACAPAADRSEAMERAAVTVVVTQAIAATDTIPPPVVTATDVPASSPSSEPTQPSVTANPTTSATTVPTNTSALGDQPSPAPSATSGDQPSPEPPVIADASIGDGSIVYGRTDEGAYFHGAADAPVTLIDYSDFL